MSHFVLVHGAWHGAWCWYKVIAGLHAAGHEVTAVDLPSLGRDPTPLGDVTLGAWASTVCDALNSSAQPSVLVGHSMGGGVISAAAERIPGQVKTLVYVSAALLRDGQTLLDMAAQNPDNMSELATLSADQRSLQLNPRRVRETFYGECAAQDVALAQTLLRPQATGPLGVPLHLTQAGYGSRPRVYIECLRDRALDIKSQRAMTSASPCAQVISMDTDHSPFFSRSAELVQHLLLIDQ